MIDKEKLRRFIKSHVRHLIEISNEKEELASGKRTFLKEKIEQGKIKSRNVLEVFEKFSELRENIREEPLILKEMERNIQFPDVLNTYLELLSRKIGHEECLVTWIIENARKNIKKVKKKEGKEILAEMEALCNALLPLLNIQTHHLILLKQYSETLSLNS